MTVNSEQKNDQVSVVLMDTVEAAPVFNTEWVSSTHGSVGVLLAPTTVPALVVNNGSDPWDAVVGGFRILAARALAGDEEVSKFLIENQVLLYGTDGNVIWPKP